MNFCPSIHFTKILLTVSLVIALGTSSISAQFFVEEPVVNFNSLDNNKTIEYYCIRSLDSTKLESIQEVLLKFDGITQVHYSDASKTLTINCSTIWKKSEINSQLLRKGIHVVNNSINRDSLKKK
jgi:hypothetical protein